MGEGVPVRWAGEGGGDRGRAEIPWRDSRSRSSSRKRVPCTWWSSRVAVPWCPWSFSSKRGCAPCPKWSSWPHTPHPTIFQYNAEPLHAPPLQSSPRWYTYPWIANETVPHHQNPTRSTPWKWSVPRLWSSRWAYDCDSSIIWPIIGSWFGAARQERRGNCGWRRNANDVTMILDLKVRSLLLWDTECTEIIENTEEDRDDAGEGWVRFYSKGDG